MESLSLKDWNDVVAVNLTGYFLCAQVFGRAMLDRREGAMVHFASVMADFPSPFTGAYSVTKAGAVMLSRQLAAEWGPLGVRSNCVSPSLVVTPMSQSTYDLPGVMEARSGTVPLGRIGLPQDMAQAVLFLVSPLASYVNGTELLVDGGFKSNLMRLVPRPGPDGKLLPTSSKAAPRP
jgi:NAD(P)-dependent dehydrogenase (short-subunit alcohol dehydrogenase family)